MKRKNGPRIRTGSIKDRRLLYLRSVLLIGLSYGVGAEDRPLHLSRRLPAFYRCCMLRLMTSICISLFSCTK